MELYDYQKDCVGQAIEKNVIVNLPTGRGKSLIAVKVIDYYLKNSPQEKVALIVPTRPLVEQQAKYCREHCQKVEDETLYVTEVSGPDPDRWDKRKWQTLLDDSHIIVGTPAIFQQAIVTNRFVDVAIFSLFVFDECHNAVGNGPMACLMRDAIAPYKHQNPGDSPRILGLTASFVNGTMKNIAKKKRDLEGLLISTIICPNVEPLLSLENYVQVSWDGPQDPELANEQKRIVHDLAKASLAKIDNIRDVEKVVNRCGHVFCELGKDALVFFLTHVVKEQIIEKAKVLLEIENEGSHRLAQRMMTSLPDLELAMKSFIKKLDQDLVFHEAQAQSGKLKRLIQLFRDDIFVSENSNADRAIVFVEQVALVSPIAHELHKALDNINIGAVAGTSRQCSKERNGQIEKFRCGEINVLVSSAVLEEGLNVPECRIIVRFNQVTTTRAHVQGSGRARSENAKVYLFDNEARLEQTRVTEMTTIARDSALSLSNEAQRAAVSHMAKAHTSSKVHPYKSADNESGGLVSVFNAKSIFNQYCSISLRQPLSPKKDLYEYEEVNGRQMIEQIRYPTPDGWCFVTADDNQAFWKGTNMESVFSESRSQKKSRREKEEMMFVYTVVVELRKRKYLTAHNLPDLSCLYQTQKMCPLEDGPDAGLLVGNRVIQPMSVETTGM